MNYTSLRDSVLSYLSYDDLAVRDSIIDDAIGMAESRVNAELRVREMMASTTQTSNSTTGKISIPSDYIEMVSFYRSGNKPNRMEYVSPDEFYKYTKAETRYTIIGSNIETALADSSTSGNGATYTMNYVGSLSGLASTNLTNWLIEKSPRVYLYGTLMELQPYLTNPGSYDDLKNKFYSAVGDLQNMDSRGKYRPNVRMLHDGVTSDGAFRLF